jgi:hypothetical protein
MLGRKTDHIVHSDLFQSGSNLVFQEVVCAESVDVHVPTHADQLRSTQVIKRDIVLEQLGNLDDILWWRGFTGGTDFTEELLELFCTDYGFRLETWLGDSFLQELCHFDSDSEETSLLFILLRDVRLDQLMVRT